jgi:hypothetical protein
MVPLPSRVSIWSMFINPKLLPLPKGRRAVEDQAVDDVHAGAVEGRQIQVAVQRAARIGNSNWLASLSAQGIR